MKPSQNVVKWTLQDTWDPKGHQLYSNTVLSVTPRQVLKPSQHTMLIIALEI